MIHPEFETLLAYRNQQVDDDVQTSIEQHVSVCHECQTLLDNIQLLTQRLQDDEKASPRPELVRRATAAFRQFRQRLAERPKAVADLQFDSRHAASLSGVRGYSFDQQLLFHAVGLDVDLQIVPDEGQLHRVEGQILREQTAPEELEGIAVTLQAVQDDQSVHQVVKQPVRQTIADYLGRFAFSALPTGQFLLQIDLADSVVEVGIITIDAGFEV